jgi:hypothetical protein
VADYGLDPSLVGFLQGGGMPSGMPAPAPVPTQYGLSPQVVSGVQSGFAPQQVSAVESPSVQLPPPPPQHLGVNGGTGVDEVSASPDPGPASVTGGALLSDDPAAAAAAPAPQADYTAGTVNPLGVPGKGGDRELAASNKQYDKQQAMQAARATTPEGTFQKADAQNAAVIDKERQAAMDAQAAEAAKNESVATAQAESEKRQAQQAVQDAAQRKADQETTAKYATQYAQQIKDAADYKVNTDRSVGIGGLIAVALSGIGQALDHQHGPNAALQIINDGIDKQINDQWAKKKSLGDAAAQTKDVLETSRQTAADHRTDQDVQRAALTKAASDRIATITAQSANPELVARGKMIQAGLDQKAAELTTGLAQRKLAAEKAAQDQANTRAQLGVQYGHLKLAQDQFAYTQKKDADTLALETLKLNQAGNAKQSEAIQKSGVGGVAVILKDDNGNPILDKDGNPQVKQDILRNKDGTPFIAMGNDQQVGELRKKKAATDFLVNVMDETQRLRTGWSNSVTDREEWQRIQANWSAAKAKGKDLLGLGALSGDDYKLLDGFLGSSDPTKFRSDAAGISQARKNVLSMFNGEAHSMGLDGDYDPPDMSKPVAPPVTTDEQGFKNVLSSAADKNMYDSAKEYGVSTVDADGNQRSGKDIAGDVMAKLDATGSMSPSQRNEIDKWGRIINDPKATPAAKKAAGEYLEKAATQAQTKTVKTYAQAVATRAGVDAVQTTEEPETGGSSTVRDTSYGGPAQTAQQQRAAQQMRDNAAFAKKRR